MTHLPSGTNFRFAIEMECAMPLGIATPIGRFLAQNILHHRIGMAHRIAKRPAGDGADVLFELTDGAGLQRPVTGIVHARRDLVDQKRSIAPNKEFDRSEEHTSELQSHSLYR